MIRLLNTLLAGSVALGALAGSAVAQNMPKKIGYVVNYATHEWYQNVIKGMKAHAAEIGTPETDTEVGRGGLEGKRHLLARMESDPRAGNRST